MNTAKRLQFNKYSFLNYSLSVCSHRNPIMRFFCGAFLQKSDLPLRSQGCFATSCARRHIGIFLFANHNWWLRSNWRCLAVKTSCSSIACDSIFIFVPLVSKRKSGLTVWMALLQRFCKAYTCTPLFFDTKGAKKSSQKKRRLGHFARPASDKAYAALTRAHWRGGSYGLQCEHAAKH